MDEIDDRLELCRDGALEVAGACEFLGVSRSRLYELIAQGEVPVIKSGRKTLLPRRGLAGYLARHLRKADAAA